VRERGDYLTKKNQVKRNFLSISIRKIEVESFILFETEKKVITGKK
jgi:hypothetical protein